VATFSFFFTINYQIEIAMKHSSSYLKFNKFGFVYLFSVRINDTVTFVDDGLDEDIEFGDDISDDEEADAVDNVRCI